jgi:hypothetical protein
MNSIKEFNLRRFSLLIRNDLFLNRIYFLISAGVATGILLFFSLMVIFNQPQFYQAQLLTSYRLILILGGIIITGKIFKGLHNDVKGSTWLTLPASTLEKFVSRLILLTIMFPLALMALIFIVSLFFEGFNVALTGSSHGIFNPFQKEVFERTIVYIELQSPFLLGVTYFKKNTLPQTFLTIIGYLILLALIAQVPYMVIYSQYPEGFWGYFVPYGTIQWIKWVLANKSSMAYEMAFWAGNIISWCIAPVFWVTAYFRLKEKEI